MEGKARKKNTIKFRELYEQENFETAWGIQTGNIGDFAITNPDGEEYPCPKQVFLDTYVVVKEEI